MFPSTEEIRMSTLRLRLARVLGCLIVLGLSSVRAGADVVTDWNLVTQQVVGAGAATRPTPSGSLDFVMVHIAIHDAIQAFQQRLESYTSPIVGATGSPVAAAAKAARDVLVSRFPAQAGSIEATYQSYLTSKGLLPTDPGVATGAQAASNIIAARANDGSFPQNPEMFTGGTAPGEWRPTPPGFAPMSAPWFGNVLPFAQRDTASLLPEPPPPHLTSGKYADHYNEVKVFGARVGSSRTTEQTRLAYFYSDNFGNQLNRCVRDIVLAGHVTDIGDSARLFALATISAADALINAWNDKRSYNFWRPSTAIAEGDNDGNPRTAGDPGWLPLINDPPYPDYTSGANSITGAFMRTLELFFEDDAPFSFDVNSTVALAVQLTRTYSRFSDVADDVVEARILLGIHFRFADTVARRHGKQSADRVFSHLLRPLD
jgi:hypothetical protein